MIKHGWLGTAVAMAVLAVGQRECFSQGRIDDEADGRPRISGMAFDRSENAVALSVDCRGLTNETVNILYKDIGTGQGYSDVAPWQVAEEGVSAAGLASMRWLDRGGVGRTKNDGVVGRIYMIRWEQAGDASFARTTVDLTAAADEFQWPAERRADWSAAGLPGTAFPEYATVINVKSFGARADGTTDDSTAINNAINSATGPAVVFIPSGTYAVAKSIYLKSNIILRGEGSRKTRLLFKSSGTANRCIGAIKWDSDQTDAYVVVTNGLGKESTVLYLASVSGFATGDVVEIQQQNDPAWGFTESWQSNVVGQIVRVVSVDSARRCLTIDQPLRITFSAARRPVARKLNVLRGIGIEDLYLEKTESINGYTIEFKHVVDSWVRRVESYNTYKGHLWLERCAQIEVRQNYFHHSFVYGGDTQGYGVSCTRHTSGCLIEDNVFNSLRHSMVLEIGANGNVYGYNFSTNRARDPVSGNLQADISVHGHYVFMNLFEGNVAEDADVPDWFEPAGPGNSLFRCRVMNSGTAIEVASDNENVVGNELPTGAIAMVSGTTNTLVHGNNSRGTIVWSNGLSHVLPASLYRDGQPEFFPSTDPEIPWPPLGPDCTLGAGWIPAQKRFASGIPVPIPAQSNACPFVAVTSPSSGSLFTAPANIILAASASDSDGVVTQVAFYCGTTLLGIDTASPYECVWAIAPTGSHALTAMAWDDRGAEALSTSVEIAVAAPPIALVNLALASRGSTITGNNGGSWSLAIDGDATNYTTTSGFAYTYWRKAANSPGSMVLDLQQVCTVYNIKILLWDKDNRYYRYKVEGSEDGVTWTMLADRTSGRWKSWQEIVLDVPAKVKYLKLTGTYNTTSSTFHVVEWEVYGTEEAVEPPPAISNLALASRGSTITGNNGGSWSLAIDGDATNYTSTGGFAYTYWQKGVNSPGSMVLDLQQVCTVYNIKILLWDKDNRYYRYKVEGSEDGVTWTMLADRTSGQWKSWQEIVLDVPAKVRYLKLTGTYNTTSSTFHVVEWEVYGTSP